MRKLTLLVSLSLLAAGLAASAVPVSAQAPTPTYVEGITFRAPVRMTYTDPAQVGGPGEPSIEVGQDGTIYTAGVCCVARAAPAWYSKDGGLTFRDLPSPGSARQHGIGAEGDFIVDDAGGVYFSDTWIPSILLTKWSGRGDFYEYTRDTTIGVIPGLDDRPWLAYSHGVLYMYINHGTHIAVYKSTDSGHTWSDSFSTLGRGQRYWTGHVVADRDTDDVYLFGANCELGPICAASSHDAGETWTEKAAGTLPRGARANFMVSAAIDEAGNVYGTFTDTNGSGCDVQLAVSTDKGLTWRQYRVNPELGCATFPWVEAGDDGRVSMSWYYNSAKRSQNQVGAATDWHLQAAVITDATSETPTITYGTLPGVIHRGPLNRELWDFQSIALGPDGRFHIVFAEDVAAPCSGAMLAGYQNMCTTYVGQAGGPRAITHAADETRIDTAEISSGAGGIAVAGTATFGRATPAQMLTDGSGDGAPGIDVRRVSLARASARSEHLVVEMGVDGLPEVVNGVGEYVVNLNAGGSSYNVVMTPRPWSFELCGGGTCSRIRGDGNPGGDVVVAYVPLSRLGVAAGDAVAVTGAAASTPETATCPSLGCDQTSGTASYSVPGPAVTVTVTDASGAVLAEAPAALSDDLSSYSADLSGLAPGTYSVEVEACFATNCDTVLTDEVTVS